MARFHESLATINPTFNFDAPPVASDGTIIGVYAGDKSLLNSLLPQHARH
jgi:hypothetical protein